MNCILYLHTPSVFRSFGKQTVVSSFTFLNICIPVLYSFKYCFKNKAQLRNSLFNASNLKLIATLYSHEHMPVNYFIFSQSSINVTFEPKKKQ